MPAVPSYDNFKVMPTISPAAANDLGVSIDQAAIGARQIMTAGDQITRAGQQLTAIEVDAMSEANQLRVDDSLNQLKESSLKLQFDPKTGFENTRGIDALQRESGQSLTQEYGSTLEKHASDIEGTLSNDAQKIAFRRNANKLITGFKGNVEQHEGQEFQTYALSVRDGTIKNRITEIGLNYDKPEIVSNAVKSIRAAAYDQGRLLGKSAEWSESQARESVSKAHTTAIKTALQNDNPTYATGYMQKFSSEMLPDDLLSVNSVLLPKLDAHVATETVNSVMQEMGPKITTSDSDRAFNIALNSESGGKQFGGPGSIAGPDQPTTSKAGAIGVAQVMPGTGPEAAKMAGVEWDEQKYKNDADYNRKIGKAYFDHQLVDNGGNLAMAYASYNAGPGRLQDGIKAAQAKGTPENWLQEMPAETQNYVKKNMTAFGAGAGQFDRPTLLEVQNTVRTRVGNERPERLKMALDESERQYNAVTAATKQKNEEAKANAMRAVIENGGRYTDLPANTRGALAPGDVSGVMEFANRVAKGEDTTNLWLYNKLTTNPQDLRTMTDDQFYALRSELSEGDFKHFSDERGKMLSGQAPNGPGDLNNDAITRTLNDRLNSMGIDPTPKDGSTDAERVGAVRRFVNQSIAVEQANRGKKMNDVEISGFLDSLFAQQSHVFSTSLFGSPYISKTGDIPSATKDALKAAFKRKGVDAPTDADLLNAYWRQVSLIQKANTKAKPNG